MSPNDQYYVDKSKYEPIVAKLIDAFATHNEAYKRLEHLCIQYGHRLTGSETLHSATEWVYDTMIADGLENVRKMPCQCPNWSRGAAHAVIIRNNTQHTEHSINNDTGICSLDVTNGNKYRKMNILALGSCVTALNVTAQVVIVEDYDELDTAGKAGKLKGKIVLWNKKWCNKYGECARFRWDGAKRAEQYGAVASLIRSVVSESLSSPHTGTQDDANIPGVAIAIEDAELITRLIHNNETVTVHLCTKNTTGADVTHYNVIGEIVGSEYPDEVVIVSGHLDSWDVGQGAMDDGACMITGWEVVRLLKKLGYKPKRTIRAIAWVDEEQKTSGGIQYVKEMTEQNQLHNHVAAFESDMGVWIAEGFGYAGSKASTPTVQQLLNLLAPLNATKLSDDGVGVDIGPLYEACKVPSFMLKLTDDWWNHNYFKYHHTDADTIDKVDPKWLVQNLQVKKM